MALPFHPILGRQIAERGIDLVHTQTEFGINFGRLIAKKNDLPTFIRFIHFMRTG